MSPDMVKKAFRALQEPVMSFAVSGLSFADFAPLFTLSDGALFERRVPTQG